MQTTIEIRDHDVSCVIGCLDWERRQEQSLRVNLKLLANDTGHYESDELQQTIDYRLIASQIDFLLKNLKFQLLELASQTLLKCVLRSWNSEAESFVFTEGSIQIIKKVPLSADAKAVVGVSLRSNEVNFLRDIQSWGHKEVLLQNKDSSLWLFSVLPGASLEITATEADHCEDYFVNQGLLTACEGQNLILESGKSRVVKSSETTVYQNKGDAPVVFLRVLRGRVVSKDKAQEKAGILGA
ncbi:MAG: dihydroneopterin aldolase [Deltaproteobacteria bacterium]|nr:dihydroneopterin aldolase [Deltaproteobacteria bacterium]